MRLVPLLYPAAPLILAAALGPVLAPPADRPWALPNPEAEAMTAARAAKGGVVRELAAGRVTAAEAVARFERLNAGCPALLRGLRAADPAASDAQLAARNLRSWAVDDEVTPAAPVRAALLARIDAGE